MLNRSFLILLLMSLSVPSVFAQNDPFSRGRSTYLGEGGVQGGGGDTGVELQIKRIRDDIKSWIIRGGAAELKFDERLFTREIYESGNREKFESGQATKRFYGMLEVLQPGAVTVKVIRRSEQNRADPLKNTYVQGKGKDWARKVCKGIFEYPKDKTSYLICEEEGFNTLHADSNELIDRQYQLIHHEYASLGGFEKSVGVDSNYDLSVQLSKKTGQKTERRLTISGGGVNKTNAMGMKFVLVDAKGKRLKIIRPVIAMGVFQKDATMTSETPMLDSFEIQTTPVTQEQWYKVMGYKPDAGKYRPDQPVTNVFYEQVCGPDAYLEGRNEFGGHVYAFSERARNPEICGREKSTAFIYRMNEYNDGCRYRLPTEEEWEYVAQETSGAASDEGWSEAQDADPSKLEPAAVAQKRPNQLGVYDLFGNVGEMIFGRELIKTGTGSAETMSLFTLAKGWPRWRAYPAANRWSEQERAQRYYFNLWSEAPTARDPWMGFRLLRQCGK